MKTKFFKTFATFLFVIAICISTLAGCAQNTLAMPNTNDAVTGNGSFVVQKGQYLYFANGYTAVSDLKGGDNKGGNKYSAIYRVKLDADNQLEYDDQSNLKNVELVIDKICGFDKTAFYIFGDYIYYATPNTEKVITDGSIASNFELTDFYKAKLDGTERTRIYKTENSSDKTAFAFYKINGLNDVQLVVFDGTQLVTVNTANKAKTVICESASSVALPQIADYNATNNTISKGASNVYYTRSAKEDEKISSGNVFCSAKIGENKENIIASGTYTYTAVSATNEALVFSKKLSSNSDLSANNYAISYAFDADDNVAIDLQNGGTKLDSTGHSNFYLATYEDGNCTGIVTQNDSKKIVYIKQSNEGDLIYDILDDQKELTLLGLSGNYVYAYDSNNSIYQINYKTKAQTTLLDMELSTEDSPIAKPYFDANKNFAIVGTNIYYFATYEGDDATGYYLNRISTTQRDVYEQELVGQIQSNHIKTEESK